jgi:hypothetical protein
MVIAVDFDLTCVKSNWPYGGETVEGCVEVLHELLRNGHDIILLTQREHASFMDCPDVLNIALRWFKRNGIRLYAVNEFPDRNELYYPSRKVYADVYIDDHNAGIKLLPWINKCGMEAQYVDWEYVDKWLVKYGFYKKRVFNRKKI